MQPRALNPFSIAIDDILYEEETDGAHIAVYQTQPLGLTVTFNHDIVITQKGAFFYNEMLTHPALFTHPHPKKIAILGSPCGLLEEIVKHPRIAAITCVTPPTPLNLAIEEHCRTLYPPIKDPRVTYLKSEIHPFLEEAQCTPFDMIICTEPKPNAHEWDSHFYRALNTEGILVKPCRFAWTQADTLKSLFASLKQAGFTDWQTMHFPEPYRSQGISMVLIAKTRGLFNPIREKEIYNRTFTTRYYNYDTHKAALVIPEFMRAAWE